MDEHELVTGLTYGLTDSFEVDATVPVFSIGGAPFVEPLYLLRSKYRFLETPALDLAAGLVLRLFTDRLADESTDGRTQPGLFLYGSGARLPLAAHMYLQPFVNVGADCDEVGTRDLEVRWSLGGDWGVTHGFTVATAVLANRRPLVSRRFEGSIGATTGTVALMSIPVGRRFREAPSRPKASYAQ